MVVTNNFGSVASLSVGLTVFLPPQGFKGFSLDGKQLNLQLIGTPNYPYILQATTNLTPPIKWQSVLTNPADFNGNWISTVTNLTGKPGLFYRAVGK